MGRGWESHGFAKLIRCAIMGYKALSTTPEAYKEQQKKQLFIVSPEDDMTEAIFKLFEQIKAVNEDMNRHIKFQKNKKRCLELNGGQAVYSYVYLVGPGCYDNTTVNCGKCYKTTVDVSDATSPAFIPDIMESYDWASGQYPTWTESIWKEFS